MRVRLARRHFLTTLLALAGTHAQAAERAKVVATFSVLGDMVGRIAGDKVQLATIVGGDADCELYQPTAADARAVADARLFVMNGLNPRFEPWAETLLKRAPFRGTKLVASQGANVIIDDRPRGAVKGPQTDQHAWHDPANGLIYVANIAEGLARLDPPNAAVYRAQAERYAQEIRALDAWARSELAAIPSSKRRFITSHDGFEYLARAYDIEMTPARGMVNDTDPSAEDIARLIQQIRTTKVKAIFIENMNDPRLIERVAREAGATVGGTLYSDALSKPGGDADTYLKMIRHNVSTLKAAMLKN
ncbi:metal ABC transporter solute-binding protein, Zn/Mn family [Reyranella soli]|uniref:Metal ABC transporter substrate-binding protein n=1 Tax=Reyranella soli TaxID=1230389 RepID=A0A512NND7_9HYPH|nr:zinc ABC transporter substrate-binding protein [Reyranella soli]GEP60454.1 metal ABC transporter substrate-binding protein [Reyranella soli]